MFEKTRHLHDEVMIILHGHKSEDLKTTSKGVAHVNAAENELSEAEKQITSKGILG